MIDNSVLKYSEKLKTLAIEHTILEHPNLEKVADVQSYMGVTLADGFSTIIMKANDSFIAIIRRDDCKLNFKKIKRELGITNLRMADRDEFVRLTGLLPGAAHILNSGIKTILDTKLFEKEYLNGGSGSFTFTIRYKSEDLRKIPKSIVLDVTE